MTEEQIERTVERRIDALDAKYLRGAITEAQYHAEMRRIDDWAKAMSRLSVLAAG